MVQFLQIWSFPILLIAFMVYMDMKKGQTVEEYFKEINEVNNEVWALILMPFINIIFAVALWAYIIHKRTKHLRK